MGIFTIEYLTKKKVTETFTVNLTSEELMNYSSLSIPPRLTKG